MKKSLRRAKRKLELMLLSNPDYFGHQASVLKKEIANAQSEIPQEVIRIHEQARRARQDRLADEWERRKRKIIEGGTELLQTETEASGGGVRQNLSEIDDG